MACPWAQMPLRRCSQKRMAECLLGAAMPASLLAAGLDS